MQHFPLPYAIAARNVNLALPAAVQMFNNPTQVRRIAPRDPEKVTLEALAPVATIYERPFERVLFSPERDANPFFHFFEALWILAGRGDVKWIANFLPSIAEFSDDGIDFHGAYGARLRNLRFEHQEPHLDFTLDQLDMVVALLKQDPDTRRAVCALWMPEKDSGYNGKDMPCNCTITFKLREGHLHMTVFNRSNDMVWGAYGANVVQFSTIMEYVCAKVGALPGHYIQWSDSFHIYEKNPAWQRVSKLDLVKQDPYEYHPAHYFGTSKATFSFSGPVQPYPLMDETVTFNGELLMFMDHAWSAVKGNIYGSRKNYKNTYFDEVALPLLNAFIAYKQGHQTLALFYADKCWATDWKLAALLWLHRRNQYKQPGVVT